MVYKLVSKVIVNRLRNCMKSIVHYNQNVFVEDRLITDNFMIAFKAFHAMQNGKINNTHDFTLKLDLCMDFDKVEWNYLEAIMQAIRVPTNLVAFIIRCVRTVRFLCLLMARHLVVSPPLG